MDRAPLVRTLSKFHCIFVKVPAPDSAWQVPDMVELSVKVLPALSVVPLKTTEPSLPPSPCNSKFIPDTVPATFTECKQAELMKVAVPETWPAVSSFRLRVSCTGIRSVGRTIPVYGLPETFVVCVPVQVPLSPMAAAHAAVADVTW
jgi:hypothetical protein